MKLEENVTDSQFGNQTSQTRVCSVATPFQPLLRGNFCQGPQKVCR